MADPTAKPTIKRWTYPFLSKDGKEIDDAQVMLSALATADDGTYPIGGNGLWHGGVHFDSQTASKLAQDQGVRCIADGEVVAYRIDDDYAQIDYPDGKKALYSTGFVLVRHRLELPPLPAAAATGPATSTSASAAAAEQPALVFFSLYMHTQNWARYKAGPMQTRPGFWKVVTGNYLVGGKAKDEEAALMPGKTGLRVFNAEKTAIGLVAAGAQLTLGSEHSKWPGYFQLGDIVSGEVALPDDIVAYVHRAGLDAVLEPDPGSIGEVYVLPHAKAIKAGDLIGHLGEYGRYSEATALPPVPVRPLLHFEVFTGQDIQAFITQSRARAAQLDATQKTLLVIRQGAKLCQPVEKEQTLAAGIEVQVETGEGPWVRVSKLKKEIVARSSLGAYQSTPGKGSYANGNGPRIRFTGRYTNATNSLSTDKTSEGT